MSFASFFAADDETSPFLPLPLPKLADVVPLVDESMTNDGESVGIGTEPTSFCTAGNCARHLSVNNMTSAGAMKNYCLTCGTLGVLLKCSICSKTVCLKCVVGEVQKSVRQCLACHAPTGASFKKHWKTIKHAQNLRIYHGDKFCTLYCRPRKLYPWGTLEAQRHAKVENHPTIVVDGIHCCAYCGGSVGPLVSLCETRD